MSDRRSVVMTFKVEPELATLLRDQSNTSEFIRNAVREKIGHVCPLCQGAGRVTSLQKLSAQRLLQTHEQVQCSRCGVLDFSPCHGLDEHVHEGPCDDPWMKHLEAADTHVCRACFAAISDSP